MECSKLPIPDSLGMTFFESVLIFFDRNGSKFKSHNQRWYCNTADSCGLGGCWPDSPPAMPCHVVELSGKEKSRWQEKNMANKKVLNLKTRDAIFDAKEPLD